MEIVTERLKLRSLKLEDLEAVHALHSLTETDKYNTMGIPVSISETEKFILERIMLQEETPPKKYVFCIENKQQEFVGLFGINMGLERYLKAEVWYKIHPECWNRGYATEALKGVLHFCFNTLKLHRVTAGCAVENIASMKVMEKVGMMREGRERKNLPIRGQWHDNFMYAILVEEYKK